MRYLILFLFLISCNSSKVKILHKYKNGNPEVCFYYPKGDDKSEFTIKVYYENGQLQRLLTVKSGQFVGQIISFSESGKIVEIDSLTNPCDTVTRACNGLRTIYYENGKVAERYILSQGKYEGFSQHYDTNGIIVKDYFLSNDSIKNGTYREYNKNGIIDFLGTFKDNKLVGFSYYFNSAGDTVKYEFNDSGFATLPYKKWLKDGRILTGNFTSSDKKYIEWDWYKNGVKIQSKKMKVNTGNIIAPE